MSIKVERCKIYIYTQNIRLFLGAFQQCEKCLATASCLSVRIEQSDFRWTDFHEIFYRIIVRESVENFNLHYNLKRISDTVHERTCFSMISL